MNEWELGMANQARSALATVWSFRGYELKAILAEIDEQAFVVLSPVEAVFGRGFNTLGEK